MRTADQLLWILTTVLPNSFGFGDHNVAALSHGRGPDADVNVQLNLGLISLAVPSTGVVAMTAAIAALNSRNGRTTRVLQLGALLP
ncbi:MAG: hypothetical protein WAM11_07270 [Cyanobium sp.]